MESNNQNLPAVQDTTIPATTPQDTMESRFIENLGIYRDHIEAARKAGYAESTAKNIKALKLNDPKFLNKLRERYKGFSAWNLIGLSAIEAKAIEHLSSLEPEDILKSLPSLRGTLRDIKAAAGVLADESPDRAKTVNINNIKQLMVQVNNG